MRARAVVSIVVRAVLLVAAAWALKRELADVGAGELLAQLAAYGWSHVAAGLAATAASFLVLGAVEFIALRMAGGSSSHTLSRPRILATSFVANALSQSVGLALLTGAAVRVRAYTRRGLDVAAATRVTGFVTLTTTLGLIATGAVALLASREPILVHGVSLAVRPAGAVLSLLVLTYLAWSVTGARATIGRGDWTLPRPSLTTALAQLSLSAIDWTLTAGVLFAFVSRVPGIDFWPLLRVYLIAQMVGVASHVPGGAGVLEVVIVALLSGSAPPSARASVMASLVMFRAVYYLLPLLLALAVAFATELRGAVRLRDVAIRGADVV